MTVDLNERISFSARHIGSDSATTKEMLDVIGVQSMDALINDTIPPTIRLENEVQLPDPINEYYYLRRIKEIASKNKLVSNFIGRGYYGTIMPAVIQRNILENPGWYTAYTPYQAEIAQGRLEALINFQTMIIELTGMDIANASLLDEGTAAAEAMALIYSQRSREKKNASVLVVDRAIFPQTLAVLQTRAESLDIKIRLESVDTFDFRDPSVFGCFFQSPDNSGAVKDHRTWVQSAKEQQVLVAGAFDLLSLCLYQTPGHYGVDVAVGTTQRFGVPMGFGGPHAAYIATKEEYKRSLPGRIIGLSKDKWDRPAYRMALQTREQHIKRERATSNICTAQVLPAVLASMYAVYHGPDGLKSIAQRVHGLAVSVTSCLESMGIANQNEYYFDTIKVRTDQKQLQNLAQESGINLRYFEDGSTGISFDETHTPEDAASIVNLFEKLKGTESPVLNLHPDLDVPKELERNSTFLTSEVFSKYQTEHELLRYLKRLENKDLSLVHSMISLGSCTMKLNATTEMIPVTWSEFSDIHPYAPLDQVLGYQELIEELGNWLEAITGFAKVSLQPNSGAQGEYAGLMVIRAFHKSNGEDHRNIVLIPSSAHGTNPASAVMAGMKVVIVKCNEIGNIDLADLSEKATQYSHDLAALMVTYPSTHGVFEEDIKQICSLIHQHGGQVYMDGANMNAQVGLTSPSAIGADVCHLNLHKTFCIPHGGGGPGMGPIGVATHLVPYLPVLTDEGFRISSAPFGSGSILPISHAYIAMMGGAGLTAATKHAILNANYLAAVLKTSYPILYTNIKGKNAHELIIDCREFKKVGIEVEDIAKRMMDYGYHAPTVSFPVPGTMMIEPTESETKSELDRFCEVMISIRKEIESVEKGIYSQIDNPLKNAPHVQMEVIGTEWNHPYSREVAAFPLPFLRENKFWPNVARIDSAFGDRNLICTCGPLASYAEMTETLVADAEEK